MKKKSIARTRGSVVKSTSLPCNQEEGQAFYAPAESPQQIEAAHCVEHRVLGLLPVLPVFIHRIPSNDRDEA